MNQRGAFVDSRGVRWDPNNADYEGWLSKKSKWVGEWRKRYFILKGSKLFFAKSSTDSPHGIIDLVDCLHVKSAENQAKRKYAMLVTLSNELFFLCAETEKEKDEWIAQLGKAIISHSSMFCRTEDMNDDTIEEDEKVDITGSYNSPTG